MKKVLTSLILCAFFASCGPDNDSDKPGEGAKDKTISCGHFFPNQGSTSDGHKVDYTVTFFKNKSVTAKIVSEYISPSEFKFINKGEATYGENDEAVKTALVETQMWKAELKGKDEATILRKAKKEEVSVKCKNI